MRRVVSEQAPYASRVRELAELPEGWDGAGAPPVSDIALDAASSFLDAFAATGLRMPNIFPSETSGVSLEWASAAEVVMIEVTPEGSFELLHLPPGSFHSEQRETRLLPEAIDFAKNAVS